MSQSRCLGSSHISNFFFNLTMDGLAVAQCKFLHLLIFLPNLYFWIKSPSYLTIKLNSDQKCLVKCRCLNSNGEKLRFYINQYILTKYQKKIHVQYFTIKRTNIHQKLTLCTAGAALHFAFYV